MTDLNIMMYPADHYEEAFRSIQEGTPQQLGIPAMSLPIHLVFLFQERSQPASWIVTERC